MAKVGDLHNKGINLFINDRQSFIKNLKLSKTSTIKKISSLSVDKPNSDIGVTGELIEETRVYFIQYTQTSLPEFTFPNSIFDSLAFLPTQFYVNPDEISSSNIIESSPIVLSSNFLNLTDQLISIANTANSITEFNNLADGILANADINLTNNTEFYAIAMGVAVGKSSYTYWHTQSNIDYWNSIIMSYSSNSAQSIKLKSNAEISFNDDLKAMAIADLGGAIRGGIMGGTIGSIGGPAGTLSGAFGGAFYTGLRSSTLAGAWRIAKKFFS